MTASLHRARDLSRRPPRGAALLIVMVAVALVTAVEVDLAYQTRDNLQIAGNGRDELRAQALARGSVALGRLVLHFQNKVDQAAGQGAQFATALGKPAAAQALPRPQLWKLVPVDSILVASLFGGGGDTGTRPAGGAKGDQHGDGAVTRITSAGGLLEGVGAASGGPAAIVARITPTAIVRRTAFMPEGHNAIRGVL